MCDLLFYFIVQLLLLGISNRQNIMDNKIFSLYLYQFWKRGLMG